MKTIKSILDDIRQRLDEAENELFRNSEQLKTTTIELSGTIEVKPHDEPETMTWHEAMEKFGPDGTDPDWRLPTREELLIMCLNKDENYKGEYYWSSTEYNTDYAWGQYFSSGSQTISNRTTNNDVRCVRRDQSFNYSVIEG